jgi:HSP20 family molecular chaperone IbpA
MGERPFQELRDIQKEMLRILGEVSTLASNPLLLHQPLEDTWKPRCDVFSTTDELVILVELAGVDKKSIHITTTDEYLRITGARECAYDSRSAYYYSLEIDTGAFDRRIRFPDLCIDHNAPNVTYRDGFLKIVFPLKQNREKEISIAIE